MVRRLALPAALAALMIASPGLAGPGLVKASLVQSVYVPGTEDVPLMPGLAADDAASPGVRQAPGPHRRG